MDPFSRADPAEIWGYLAQNLTDPTSPVRVMTLASVDHLGAPQLRSVILREVEPWCLTIYTDRRSPKVQQLMDHPQAQLLIWDPVKQWQLRFTLIAEVITDRDACAALWQRIGQTRAALDYLAPQAPGEILDSARPALTEPEIGMIKLGISAIDWLALGRDGHRRQRLTREGVQALVP